MYGNVGDKYIQIKEINQSGLKLNNIGEEYEIQEYYSVPHGYTSIECDGILIFVPDELFNKCFVIKEKYNRYLKQGDNIMVNVKGEFRTYEITCIEATSGGGSHYVSLGLEAVD
jgi:hypothetical protein